MLERLFNRLRNVVFEQAPVIEEFNDEILLKEYQEMLKDTEFLSKYPTELDDSKIGEVSPPGWEGTIKAMKKHKDLKTPWALAWYMKNKGYKPHYKESVVAEAGDTSKIKVENPGVLEVPAEKKFSDLPLKHYIDLAKKKGRAAVMRALLNLWRWNKNRAKDVSTKAKGIIDQLKANAEWQGVGVADSYIEDMEKTTLVEFLESKKELSEKEKSFIQEYDKLFDVEIR